MNLYDRTDSPTGFVAGALRLVVGTIAGWPDFADGARGGAGLYTSARSLRFRDGFVGQHALFPRRGCARCGPILAHDGLPLRVHCSGWTGIVNHVALTPAPSAGAYRASATWASPLPIDGARPFLKRQRSCGRGRTAAEAEAGAIGEALERYSLVYRGDELVVRTTFSRIDAIHPDAIQLFSDTQYRERAVWNHSADEDWLVPERFDPEVPVDWLQANELRGQGRTRFVPAACCLMWYQFRPNEPEFARADTIGCASGRTFADALTRALLEWIERDAMAIWWDNAIERPGLRIESFESPELDGVAEGLRAIGRELFLLDCTTDVGIPAYMAVAPRFDGSEPLVASAADLSPRRAAFRAASEAGQVWFEAQRTGQLSTIMATWLFTENTATQAFLRPISLVDAPGEPARMPAPAWPVIVESLEAVGLHGYAVNHSRDDVVLHTVRAVVPGLRHIWNRRAPGRLYDVPVKMGWLPQPRAEAELNPVRCML